jgi:hypothetical protein
MAFNPQKINYYSGLVIDKIVDDSAVTKPLTYTVAAFSTTTFIITNPYTSRPFITLAWSTDGVNFYPSQFVPDIFDTKTVHGWTDANSIYIYIVAGTSGPFTFTVKYALDLAI